MYWTSHEAGIPPIMNERVAMAFYGATVNKREYPDFEGWLWDMERSAVLFRHDG